MTLRARLVVACLFSLFSISAHSACLSAPATSECPVGIGHLQSLKAADSCFASAQNTDIARQDCLGKAAEGTSDHALFQLFGLPTAGMSAAKMAEVLKIQLAKNEADVVDELARIDFEEKVRLNGEIDIGGMRNDFNRLKTRAAAARSRANQNKDPGVATRLYNESPEAKALQAFINSEDAITVRKMYRITNPNEFVTTSTALDRKVYRPFVANGMDLANMQWEDLPETTQINGRTANLKKGYTDFGKRTYAMISNQLMDGTPLDEVMNSAQIKRVGLSPAQIKSVKRTFHLAGMKSQLDTRRRPFPRLRARTPDLRFEKSSNGLRRLGAGLGLLSLGVGIGIDAAMRGVQNQIACDQAYPYSPVTYSQPAISGDLPQSMKCGFSAPDPSKALPAKVRTFLKLPAEEQMAALNESTDRSSICSYVVQDFNSRFCSTRPEGVDSQVHEGTQ